MTRVRNKEEARADNKLTKVAATQVMRVDTLLDADVRCGVECGAAEGASETRVVGGTHQIAPEDHDARVRVSKTTTGYSCTRLRRLNVRRCAPPPNPTTPPPSGGHPKRMR